jgi:hypothetical protein
MDGWTNRRPHPCTTRLTSSGMGQIWTNEKVLKNRMPMTRTCNFLVLHFDAWPIPVVDVENLGLDELRLRLLHCVGNTFKARGTFRLSAQVGSRSHAANDSY